MFAGMALGGIHIANAQNSMNHEIDNSRYTVVIPSEVNIDKSTGKGSFAVTGKVKAQSTIDVSIQSKNGYKLKDKNGELPYNIDKKSFSIDNSRSASDIPLNEEFNIVSKTNTKVSGNYTDSLTFDITGEAYKYRLDVNGNLDGNGVGDGRLDNFGRFDVYLNGKLVKENAEDFCEPIPYGTIWEIKNIRSLDGYRYKESSDIRTKGVAGDVVEWEGDLLGDTSIYRITYVNLKFFTNKLTINYHADGATKLLDWSTKPESYKDISGVDIFHSTTNVYGTAYSNGAGGLTDVDRLSGKQGYKVLIGYWKINKNGEQKYSDNIGFKNTEDCAEYLGVLNELNKNDVTVDLYPIWIPNTYTLTYILDGGSFNASTTQLFKYGSGDAISSEIPIKTGYVFTGWRFNEVVMQPGDKIPNNWGNFTLTAQWEKKVYSAGDTLDIEGSQYIVIEQKDNDKYLVIRKESIGSKKFQSTYDRSTGLRSDGENASTYEGSEIDNYIENEWYNGLSSTMKMAIQATNIKQASYKTYNDPDSKQETGYNSQVYNTISRHAFLPSVSEIGKAVNLKNPDKVKAFLNGTSIWTRDSYQGNALAAEYLSAGSGSLSTNRVYGTFGVRPAFVIDLSKVNYTVTGSVNYK